MREVLRPAVRPARPFFSSGPCAKHPGWKLENLHNAVLGRSHRSKAGKAKLIVAIDLTREVLGVPANYRIGIVPASDTGAVEMALWSMLGARPLDILAWESFGEGLEAPAGALGAGAGRKVRNDRPHAGLHRRHGLSFQIAASRWGEVSH
jgi:phosphoserine aminotransferase